MLAEEFIGVFKSTLFLPQYLMTATAIQMSSKFNAIRFELTVGGSSERFANPDIKPTIFLIMQQR